MILGVRFGLTEHNKDNARTFSFNLDAEDLERIAEAKKGSRDCTQPSGTVAASTVETSSWTASS